MFFDPSQFPFASRLEESWQAILEEYRAVRADFADWPEKKLYDEGWQVFGIFNFPKGEPIEANVRRCPITASLIQEHIPGHGAAGFSLLLPGTRIRPHVGYQGNYLRCHLGLRVPTGDCALQVNGEKRNWETGKVLIFDDRFLHDAWNLTGEERVVLLVDFVP